MHSFSKVGWNDGRSLNEVCQSVVRVNAHVVLDIRIYMHFVVFLQSRIELLTVVHSLHVHSNTVSVV